MMISCYNYHASCPPKATNKNKAISMVSLPQQPTRMTEAEYLIFERESEIKHEYANGEIFAMSGATENHNLISVNILTILKRQLRGKGCKVYPADMRLRVQ